MAAPRPPVFGTASTITPRPSTVTPSTVTPSTAAVNGSNSATISLFGSKALVGSASSTTASGVNPLWSHQISSEETHSKLLMRHLAGLFNDTKYSDATVRIHNVTLPVHKSVICTQSKYFEKAFREGMAEGASNVIQFKEGSGAAHWRVFEYLYTGNYSEDLSTADFEDDHTLLKDPLVYALADMFFLENLKTLSERKLQTKLKSQWTSDSFPDCIREVYASTYSTRSNMRSFVVGVATVHAHELNQKDGFKELIKEGGDFAIEYIDSLLKVVKTFSA